MGSRKSEAAGWGYRLAAMLITVVVLAVIFAFAFESTGNEIKAIVRAAIPFGSAILVSTALGSINRLSHKRWQIYLTVLLLAAVIICLQIARIL